MSAHRRTHRARERGLTLLEVMIAVAVLTLISVLIYGAFSTINRGKMNASQLAERYRLARMSMNRISRELSEAYLSAHLAATPALNVRNTAFIGTSRRVDFNAFAHRRIVKDSHESDQCEISYFVGPDPKKATQSDLARREQIIIDDLPGKGGVSSILIDDVDSFNLKYLDPLTGLWTDTWDSTSAAGQLGRMPLQVQIKIVMKGGPAGDMIRLATKTPVMMPQPLAFALK
jgi:general secretion pathway protein J